MNNKPLLCRLGLHKRYRYLPKVGGDLGDSSIACLRCGYGQRYFTGEWDIPPDEIKQSISQQAEIEYGRIIGFYKGLPPLLALELAYGTALKKFSADE